MIDDYTTNLVPRADTELASGGTVGARLSLVFRDLSNRHPWVLYGYIGRQLHWWGAA